MFPSSVCILYRMLISFSLPIGGLAKHMSFKHWDPLLVGVALRRNDISKMSAELAKE